MSSTFGAPASKGGNMGFQNIAMLVIVSLLVSQVVTVFVGLFLYRKYFNYFNAKRRTVKIVIKKQSETGGLDRRQIYHPTGHREVRSGREREFHASPKEKPASGDPAKAEKEKFRSRNSTSWPMLDTAQKESDDGKVLNVRHLFPDRHHEVMSTMTGLPCVVDEEVVDDEEEEAPFPSLGGSKKKA